jgi:hypothetical protein
MLTGPNLLAAVVVCLSCLAHCVHGELTTADVVQVIRARDKAISSVYISEDRTRVPVSAQPMPRLFLST